MAVAGDILLDGSGNRLLDASGNVSLHKGDGTACGCGCLSCTPHPGTLEPNSLLVSFHYTITRCNYQGDGSVLQTMIYDADAEVVVTRSSGFGGPSPNDWRASPTTVPGITFIDLGFACTTNACNRGTPTSPISVFFNFNKQHTSGLSSDVFYITDVAAGTHGSIRGSYNVTAVPSSRCPLTTAARSAVCAGTNSSNQSNTFLSLAYLTVS